MNDTLRFDFSLAPAEFGRTYNGFFVSYLRPSASKLSLSGYLISQGTKESHKGLYMWGGKLLRKTGNKPLSQAEAQAVLELFEAGEYDGKPTYPAGDS